MKSYSNLKFLTTVVVFLLTAISIHAQDTVAYYPFSQHVDDVSGFGNDAVISGAKLTSDRFGLANQAFSFDGTAGITAPNASQLLSDFTTVCFWVNIGDLPEQGEVFLLSFGGWQERFKISVPNHGRPVFTTNSTSGISDMDSGEGNELTIGTWAHVAFVHDGVMDKIYVDGVLTNQKEVAGALNTTASPLGIGFDPIGQTLFFTGALDEVMMFDYALADADIAAIYADQSVMPTFTAQMVANYPMDNSGVDLSSSANHGSLTAVSPGTNRFGFGHTALRFDGENSKFLAANTALLNSSFTSISMWVRAYSLPEQGEVYLLSNGGWQQRLKISLPDHGKPVFTTNGENGISDMDSGDDNVLAVGAWTHLAFVHDGAKDIIYVNGSKANEKEVIGELNSTDSPLGIGFNAVDGGGTFDGMIDDVMIFNTAMDSTSIDSLYTAQSTSSTVVGDLVASYSFSGSLADDSPLKNDGIDLGAEGGKDRFGLANNAITTGEDKGVMAANSVVLNTPLASVSFWVKVDQLPEQGEVFLLSNGGWQERWKISLPSHGKPVFTTNADGISDMDSGGDENALQDSVWTHLCMVHDGSKDLIYINGVLANEKEVVGDLNPTNFPLGIGFNSVDGGGYFNGSLDDIQIFSTALSAAEVAALYGDQSVAEVIPDTLVAFYPFDGNANDATPYNNHATSTDALLTDDRFGLTNKAYAFNGTSSEVTAQNSDQLNSPLASVSFWTYINQLPEQGESYLISFGGWQERFKISLPSHGKPVWTTNHENGISDMDSGEGNELPVGEWKHVVMVHDGALDKIYIDGEKVAEKEVVGNLNSTTHPLGMGFNQVDGGSYFNGKLDEVKIFTIALTDAEIQALFADESEAPVNEDMSAPSVVLDLMGMVENTSVALNWKPSSDNVGVVAYNVFQDSSKIGTTSTVDYSITGLPQLTTIQFGVSAVDAAGNESGQSFVTLTTGEEASPDTTAPSAPGNLTGEAGSNSVLLSWEASIDDRQLAGYVVLVDGVFFDSLDASATSSFISGLDSETPYTFEVYAFDNADNISEISEITVSTTAELDTGEEGLVAWYPFEGNAADATPYANHGAEGGDPIYEDVADRINASGQAIVLDGDADSVLVPNAVQLISDYTTVSFWVRVDGQNVLDAEAYILDFGHWNERWKISLPQHLKIVWTTNSKNDMFEKAISDMDSGDGNELTTGFWWYVTMVHDGTDDIVYVDGVEVNRKPAAGTLNSTARDFCMGSNNVDGGQYFEGALDEVKIYNKALTAEEISSLYNTGTTPVAKFESIVNQYIQIAYPNPVTNDLKILHQLPANQDLAIRVFNMSGIQLDEIRIDKSELGSQQLTVPFDKLSGGTYQLNFIFGGKNLGSISITKQ